MIANVQAPTLLMIGSKDLRVPPFQVCSLMCIHIPVADSKVRDWFSLRYQGKLWFDWLQRKGVPSRMLVYPEDEHRLGSVECTIDVFVNTAIWFHKYLPN